MADKSWKAFERRVATRVGGTVIPVTGEPDGTGRGRGYVRLSSEATAASAVLLARLASRDQLGG